MAATHIIDRGFTGHEHLDQFGVINMNGRLYDPLVGRFLGPDMMVQVPAYTQSYNRYSYYFNNPLKYTDPTGWESKDPDPQYYNPGFSPEAWDLIQACWNNRQGSHDSWVFHSDGSVDRSTDGGDWQHYSEVDFSEFMLNDQISRFENAASQGGSGLLASLNGVGNPSTTIDVLIWHSTGGKDVGHTAIRVGNSIYGYYPTDTNGNGVYDMSELFGSKGEMHIDDAVGFSARYKGDVIDSYTLLSSPNQESTLGHVLDYYARNPGEYSLLGRNCTTVAEGALKGVGIIDRAANVSNSYGIVSPASFGAYLSTIYYPNTFTVK